jgi:hypothetical protein
VEGGTGAGGEVGFGTLIRVERSWTQGLERDNFVGSQGNHSRTLFVFSLDFINTRLKLVVPLLLLYILLLQLRLVSFELFILSSQGSHFLGLSLALALNGS